MSSRLFILLFATLLISAPSLAFTPEATHHFVEKNNFRCNGHFEVIDIGIADTQKCLQRCDKINSCLFFSMLSKSNVCYLFNATAVCASTPDPWITAQKDSRMARSKEDDIAFLFCPEDTRINAVNATVMGPACSQRDVSDVVEDICNEKPNCTVSVTKKLFPQTKQCSGTFHFLARVKCKPMSGYHEDKYFKKWSSRYWSQSIAEAPRYRARWKHFLEMLPDYPIDRFHDKGIIIVAGGKYLRSALVSIHMLRQLGCTLRIQVWHLGSQEMKSTHLEILHKYDVETRDFIEYVPPELLTPIKTSVGLRTFQLKPLAILYTDLKEVLLLDSDNTPLMDPTYLFTEEIYKSLGTLFWRDYWKSSSGNPIWEIIGIDPHETWEQESGQLLIDKRKAWAGLNLCIQFNNEFYMQFINGDKDTFHFAWMAAGTPFYFNTHLPAAIGSYREDVVDSESGFCGHTMLQYDLDGRPLFIHHNQLKDTILPLGENFKFQKRLVKETSRILPVSGLKYGSHLVGCNDVVNDEPFSQQVSAEPSGLGPFEIRYFAASSLFADVFLENIKGNAPLRIQRDDHNLVNVTANCDIGQFELQPDVCEVIRICTSQEIELEPPTASTDRICDTAVPIPDGRTKTIQVSVSTTTDNFQLSTDNVLFPPGAPIQLSQGGIYFFTLTNDLLPPIEFAIRDKELLVIAGGISSAQDTVSLIADKIETFDYFDPSGLIGGNTLEIVMTSSFHLRFSGSTSSHSGPHRRFDTAYDKGMHLFAMEDVSLTFADMRQRCKAECLLRIVCRGIHVFHTSQSLLCYGLSNLGGVDGSETLLESESWEKIANINDI